jgi:hypothetical protein
MSDILSKDAGLLGPFPFIVDLFCYIPLPSPTIIEKLEPPISLQSTSPALFAIIDVWWVRKHVKI